uniref:Uncharacterized protein n=1 Tax=Cannabis sativa TaxID=3483 RepID=A0A803NX59_CANSA
MSSSKISPNPFFQPLGPVKEPLSADHKSDADDSIKSHKTMAQNRTLKELVVPNLGQQPRCIHYPPLDINFELKSNLIHLLPAFHGFLSEDPNNLKEFHIVCSSMKLTSITEEQIKLQAFPFSLKDAAKE